MMIKNYLGSAFQISWIFHFIRKHNAAILIPGMKLFMIILFLSFYILTNYCFKTSRWLSVIYLNFRWSKLIFMHLVAFWNENIRQPHSLIFAKFSVLPMHVTFWPRDSDSSIWIIKASAVTSTRDPSGTHCRLLERQQMVDAGHAVYNFYSV